MCVRGPTSYPAIRDMGIARDQRRIMYIPDMYMYVPISVASKESLSWSQE